MSEPIPLTPISVQKRLIDLVAFSVSDGYFACRRHLGLNRLARRSAPLAPRSGERVGRGVGR